MLFSDENCMNNISGYLIDVFFYV